MGELNRTLIDWCEFTWNPVRGCLHRCRWTIPNTGVIVMCYAERMAVRAWGSFEPQFFPERLGAPAARRRPAMIFAGSMTDFFSPGVLPAWRRAVLDVIEACPRHTFIVLTKRPDLMAKDGFGGPYSNLWIGTSVSQAGDLWRVAELGRCTNTRRLVSFEPLMGPLALGPEVLERFGIRWAIIGGLGSTRYDWAPPVMWVSDLLGACRVAGVPVWIKANTHFPNLVREFPATMLCQHKKNLEACKGGWRVKAH